MSSLWIDSNGDLLVDDAGDLYHDTECCCDGLESCPTIASDDLEVSVSGLTNGSCSDCTDANGNTYTLSTLGGTVCGTYDEQCQYWRTGLVVPITGCPGSSNPHSIQFGIVRVGGDLIYQLTFGNGVDHGEVWEKNMGGSATFPVTFTSSDRGTPGSETGCDPAGISGRCGYGSFTIDWA